MLPLQNCAKRQFLFAEISQTCFQNKNTNEFKDYIFWKSSPPDVLRKIDLSKMQNP